MRTFLETYQRHECLWNVKHGDYHNKSRRNTAVLSMLKDLNLPGATVEDVHKKIKTVRSTYKTELNKIRNSERSGAGTDDVYKPQLAWFRLADAFLRNVSLPRKSCSNLKVSEMEVMGNLG